MKLNTIILTALFFALSQPLYAKETGYEVELIIFEIKNTRYLDSEDWSYNDMLNQDKDIADTQSEYQDSEFMELDWQQAKLSESLKKIESSSKYNILFKKRWRQTGLDRDKAYALEITSLENPLTNVESEVTDNSEVPREIDSILVSTANVSPEITSLNDEPSYIQGRIKLIMSRYLHFEVNLNYFQLHKDDVVTEYRSYPVVSERRMRSREIHYLDHPMIGIIVHALPFKIEPKDIQDKAMTTLPTAIN